MLILKIPILIITIKAILKKINLIKEETQNTQNQLKCKIVKIKIILIKMF